MATFVQALNNRYGNQRPAFDPEDELIPCFGCEECKSTTILFAELWSDLGSLLTTPQPNGNVSTKLEALRARRDDAWARKAEHEATARHRLR